MEVVANWSNEQLFTQLKEGNHIDANLTNMMPQNPGFN